MRLRHLTGVRTHIVSDLTSPVRERRVTAHFDRGRLVGHYPISEADHHMQVTETVTDQPPTRRVAEDDALTACVLAAYRELADAPGTDRDYAIGQRVVELLHQAKTTAREANASGAPPHESPLTPTAP